MIVSDLRLAYEGLRLPDGATAQDKRKRGYAFENFLGALLADEGLSPRIRLRPGGEEIDGSFELADRTYLLEAKWHASPLPASSVYAFKGKVDGKLIGTIGVFVSMSAYADDAVDALTAGKVVNVLLFDRSDVEASVEHGFTRVLRAKLRAAAEEGVVFFPFTSQLAEVTSGESTEVSEAPNDEREPGSASREVVVICEGVSGARVISTLARRILEEGEISATLRVIVSHGKQGVARLANAIHPLVPAATPIIAVVDGDHNVESVWTVREAVDVPLELIAVDPEIEVWFFPGADEPRAEARVAAREVGKTLDHYLEERSLSTDLGQLLESAPGFHIFYDAVVSAARQHEGQGRS